MKEITEEDYKTLFPTNRSFDVEMLPDNLKEIYLTEYSMYHYWLSLYLSKKTNILSYEKSLDEDKFPYDSPSKIDIYQYLSSDVFKYFYIRNNFNFGNLNKSQFDFLLNHASTYDYEYNDEVEKFISESYKKVIKINNIDDNTKINYGPPSHQEFYVKNGELIIGARFDYNINYRMNEDDVIHGLFNFNNVCTEMQDEISSSLGMNVNIIKYDENSIIEMKNNKELNL